MRIQIIMASLAIIGTALISTAGPDQTGPALAIDWRTIDCGGGSSSAAGLELAGTAGQHDAAAALKGGAYTLQGGFWVDLGDTLIDTCPPDITGDLITNVDDLLAVISAWGPCTVGLCLADISPPPSGDDLVNVDDLLAVISGWGACP